MPSFVRKSCYNNNDTRSCCLLTRCQLLYGCFTASAYPAFPALMNFCGGGMIAARPAGARGEPMASAPPVERVVRVQEALGDFEFGTL